MIWFLFSLCSLHNWRIIQFKLDSEEQIFFKKLNLTIMFTHIVFVRNMLKEVVSEIFLRISSNWRCLTGELDRGIYKVGSEINGYFQFFPKSIEIFMNNYFVPMKVIPLSYNTILEILLKRALWYHQQLLLWFFFYLLNLSKTPSQASICELVRNGLFHDSVHFWQIDSRNRRIASR